jgi:hypothetical protein
VPPPRNKDIRITINCAETPECRNNLESMASMGTRKQVLSGLRRLEYPDRVPAYLSADYPACVNRTRTVDSKWTHDIHMMDMACGSGIDRNYTGLELLSRKENGLRSTAPNRQFGRRTGIFHKYTFVCCRPKRTHVYIR